MVSIGNLDSDTDEGNTTNFGNLSFFSSDTHTKYPPTLETVWDDSKWSTGSLSPLTQTNLEGYGYLHERIKTRV